MNDLLLIGLILAAWIALNRWILPAMGIETCMSGGCCGGSCRVPASEEPGRQDASAPTHDGETPEQK